MNIRKKTSFAAFISTFILCFAFWMLITWSVNTDELILGALVAVAVALFSARFLIHEKPFWLFNPLKLVNMLIYAIIIFPIELIKANLDVAFRALNPKLPIKPAIVKIPVNLESDYGKAMLANSITLTPGTITVDIEEEATEEGNKTYYYIHCISFEDKDRVSAGDDIKGTMEKWVRRVFK